MSEYLVLARKYRSTTFEELVGQEPIAQTLRNAIAGGRIAHAYLFTGTRGVGKTTVARILAKALNCLSFDAPTPTPCNRCDACVAIARGDDMDVVEIDGASNRGIGEIRELRANAIFRPTRSRYRIYYIDEVHMLTKEAFNALLKTLEEPPEHVKFIFATTELEKVPATINSRCQRFDFRSIPVRLIAEHLARLCAAEGVEADEDALFRIARAAAGSMRDALSLLDQILAGSDRVSDGEVVRILGTPPDERVLTMVRAISAGDTASALEELNAILESGVTLASAATALAECYRNMMLAATCGADSPLIELPEAQRHSVAEVAKSHTTPSLVHAVGICQNVSRSLRGSSVARALLEAAVVRLAEADKFVDPLSLLQRLESQGPLADQKKNLTPRPAAAESRPQTPATTKEARDDPREDDPPPTPLTWQEDWLQANWHAVVDRLTTNGQRHLAGMLHPAKVLAFADGTLRLGLSGDFEPLADRCRQQAQQIQSALSALAERAIACEFVTSQGPATQASDGDRPAGNGGGVPARLAGYAPSSAERAELQKDPAVQAVLHLFGGDVFDIQRHAIPAPPASDDLSDEQEDAGEDADDDQA